MHKQKVKTHYDCTDNLDYYQYVFDNPINTSGGGNGGHGKKWNGIFADEGVMKGANGNAWGGQGGNTIVKGLHIANYVVVLQPVMGEMLTDTIVLVVSKLA
jgi:hypothetical protein